MTDKIEAIATDTIGDIAARVAGAMEAAVKDYGPDAVDLALLAYQVQAVQSLVFGVMGVVALIAITVAYVKIWRISADHNDPDFARVFGAMAAIALGVCGLALASRLLSAVHWLAAFGYPELLIATKALQAAGLL